MSKRIGKNGHLTWQEALAILQSIGRGDTKLTCQIEPQTNFLIPYQMSLGGEIRIFAKFGQWRYVDSIIKGGRSIDHAHLAETPAASYSPSDNIAWRCYGLPGHMALRNERWPGWVGNRQSDHQVPIDLPTIRQMNRSLARRVFYPGEEAFVQGTNCILLVTSLDHDGASPMAVMLKSELLDLTALGIKVILKHPDTGQPIEELVLDEAGQAMLPSLDIGVQFVLGETA